MIHQNSTMFPLKAELISDVDWQFISSWEQFLMSTDLLPSLHRLTHILEKPLCSSQALTSAGVEFISRFTPPFPRWERERGNRSPNMSLQRSEQCCVSLCSPPLDDPGTHRSSEAPGHCEGCSPPHRGCYGPETRRWISGSPAQKDQRSKHLKHLG